MDSKPIHLNYCLTNVSFSLQSSNLPYLIQCSSSVFNHPSFIQHLSYCHCIAKYLIFNNPILFFLSQQTFKQKQIIRMFRLRKQYLLINLKSQNNNIILINLFLFLQISTFNTYQTFEHHKKRER